jgi:hypothetical protein
VEVLSPMFPAYLDDSIRRPDVCVAAAVIDADQV